jgi:putative serine protease PepD
VVPDSAADRAGLQPDDTITRLGETKIEKFTDLQEAIREHPPGAKVKIEFSRGGETIQSVVDLGRL